MTKKSRELKIFACDTTVVIVRGGILSVADYNSTWMGVGVVFVVVVVEYFHDGIT